LSRGRIEPGLCTAGIPAGVFDFADALCTAGLRPAFLIFVGGAKAYERQPRYGAELQGTSDSERLQVFSTSADRILSDSQQIGVSDPATGVKRALSKLFGATYLLQLRHQFIRFFLHRRRSLAGSCSEIKNAPGSKSAARFLFSSE
jgi:hypothetical protein